MERTTLSDSKPWESMPETPSPSSPVKPLNLREAPGLLAEGRMLEVAALALNREVWRALETVFKAEQAHHLQEAAFSNDPELRSQHRGVVRWLGEVLNGNLAELYAQQARERLGLTQVTPDGVPEGGSDWMESDGLSGEE